MLLVNKMNPVHEFQKGVGLFPPGHVGTVSGHRLLKLIY